MRTTHRILFGDARHIEELSDSSVSLIVTSPPYPMVEMWDASFAEQDPGIDIALKENDGNGAFERMHRLLDEAWNEVYRVLKPGGFACINIGDATRTIDRHFRLYPNHSRVLSHCMAAGFTNLPPIIWRKQTNAPNKFMGSGMLPAGAYVTLEHEFVLILRKGNKREFKTAVEKKLRMQSALFWEERNNWFSDIWFDLKGTGQALNQGDARKRSAAFPFELAYRLINMFSVKGDTVLDPFLGTGTTTLAAIASARNSIGVEIDARLSEAIVELLADSPVKVCNTFMRRRLANHLEFVATRKKSKGENAFKYRNRNYAFPVITRQETDLLLNAMTGVDTTHRDVITATYSDEAVLDLDEVDSLFTRARTQASA